MSRLCEMTGMPESALSGCGLALSFCLLAFGMDLNIGAI